MNEVVQEISQELSQSSYLEFIAMITGIWSVWLASKNNILVFPIGIISTGIYVYVYLTVPIYALSGLNVYFTILSMIGWYNWSQVENDIAKYPISWCSSKEYIYLAFSFIFIIGLLLYVLRLSGESDPWRDAFSTGFQVLGMWWMTRRKIENWIAWTIANIIAIPLCIQSHLYFTSFQYLIFIGISISGFIEWRKLMKEGESAHP